MSFYPPFLAEIKGKPAICYFDTDALKNRGTIKTAESRRFQAAAMIAFFNANAYDSNNSDVKLPEDTDFVIAFFWQDNQEQRFVDLWLQRQFATYGECGPMNELLVFDDGGSLADRREKGDGCVLTRIIAGREAEHFYRMVRQEGKCVEEYLAAPRPEIPFGLIVPWGTEEDPGE